MDVLDLYSEGHVGHVLVAGGALEGSLDVMCLELAEDWVKSNSKC